MKTRIWLIVILIVAMVVVYSLLVTAYLNQNNQKATLEVQVADATAALALIPQPPTDLQERLAAAQDTLAAEKDSFSIDTNNTRIVNKILELAKANGVKAIPLTTQSWVSETISNQIYSVFRIDLAVTGNYPQLVNFLTQLENGVPKTLIIERLMVETIPGSSLLDSAARNALTISANVKIAIYAPPIAAGN